ncbi:unnamed protein product, partial [Amoebophrya sp. A25]|eukprot:GSA25T00022856001.1
MERALFQTQILKKEIMTLRTVHRVRSEEEALGKLSEASVLWLFTVLVMATLPSLLTVELFQQLPADARQGLLFRDDGRGGPLLVSVDPERLLADLTRKYLTKKWPGYLPRYYLLPKEFHDFSVEGRCPVPTAFDATLGWALGHCAACLVQTKMNGYLACVTDLLQAGNMWQAEGVRFEAFLDNLETGSSKGASVGPGAATLSSSSKEQSTPIVGGHAKGTSATTIGGTTVARSTTIGGTSASAFAPAARASSASAAAPRSGSPRPSP